MGGGVGGFGPNILSLLVLIEIRINKSITSRPNILTRLVGTM